MSGAHSLARVAGHVVARLRNADGTIAQQIEGHNLVVDLGLTAICNLLTGNGLSGSVVQMICGSGTNWVSPRGAQVALDNQPASGISIAKTIASTDMVVTAPATGGNVSGVATVLFRATWAQTENNGFVTNEVGLFAAGPKLIARYVFPAPGIPKTAAQQLEIDYTLTFTAS